MRLSHRPRRARSTPHGVLLALATAAAAASPAASCPFARFARASGSDAAGGSRAGSRDLLQAPGLTPPVCAATGGAAPSGDACAAAAAAGSAFRDALDGRNGGARSALAAAALRLAFHDAGEYARFTSDTAGPDGCLSANADNAGLVEADQEVMTVLEPIWQDHCAGISRADFWALAGGIAAASLEPTGALDRALEVRVGRVDRTECEVGDGRLPDANVGGDAALADIFETRMGLSVADGVTLLGAHTLGTASPEHSGFGANGSPSSWSRNPGLFDNDYYETLVQQGWARNAAGNGGDQWTRNDGRIMLNADMAIAFDIGAEDGDPNENRCGGGGGGGGGGRGGGGGGGGCAPSSTRAQVDRYIGSNANFVAEFAAAYNRMVAVGYGGGRAADGSIDARLGTLDLVDIAACPAGGAPEVAPTPIPAPNPVPTPEASPVPTPEASPVRSPVPEEETEAPTPIEEAPEEEEQGDGRGDGGGRRDRVQDGGDGAADDGEGEDGDGDDDAEDVPPPPPPRRRRRKGFAEVLGGHVAGSGIIAAFLLFGTWGVWFNCRRRKEAKAELEKEQVDAYLRQGLPPPSAPPAAVELAPVAAGANPAFDSCLQVDVALGVPASIRAV